MHNARPHDAALRNATASLLVSTGTPHVSSEGKKKWAVKTRPFGREAVILTRNSSEIKELEMILIRIVARPQP